jgi:hypothetical protein
MFETALRELDDKTTGNYPFSNGWKSGARNVFGLIESLHAASEDAEAEWLVAISRKPEFTRKISSREKMSAFLVVPSAYPRYKRISIPVNRSTKVNG